MTRVLNAILVLTERVLLVVGAVCVIYSASAFAYGAWLERYESFRFERQVAGTDASGDPLTLPVSSPSNAREGSRVQPGDTVGRLEVPRLGLSVMIHHGVESDVLRAGAGHVPGTPLPGAEGNSAIAGHRDTFFRPLEHVVAGDLVRVTTPGGIQEYVVEWTKVVGPDDTSVLESREAGSELTLITCYPFYYVGPAPNRFAVRARPVTGSRPSERR